jgi:hypothetical protein
MRCCNQKWAFAAALALAVAAAGIGWALYFREKQKTNDLQAKFVAVTCEVAHIESRAAQEVEMVLQAQRDMRNLEKAVRTYYTQTGAWPDSASLATQIAPLMERGENCLQSPWPGVLYQYHIDRQPDPDGSIVERPVITCQPPGRPSIQWPPPLR